MPEKDKNEKDKNEKDKNEKDKNEKDKNEKDCIFLVTINPETHLRFKMRCAEKKITMVRQNEALWKSFGNELDDDLNYISIDHDLWSIVCKGAKRNKITPDEYANKLIRILSEYNPVV